MLPYVNQMTVLADIFRVVGHPSAQQLRAIGRWFWKTSLAGYFGGWNTGSMARDHTAVEAFGAASTSEIEFFYTEPSHAIWRTRQFRSNNSLAKTFAIILCNQAPLDLLNGQKIDVAKALAWDNQKEFHHFFPRKYLETRGETERINALANIVLLTSASNKTISASQPSKYLLEVAAHAGPNLDLWLSSNLINKAAYDAALKDDYDGFLEARSKYIHDAVLSMTKSVAAP